MRVNSPNVGSFRDKSKPIAEEHREDHAEFQQQMLQVRIKVSVLPRQCKLAQVHVLCGCFHGSVDCQNLPGIQDVRGIPVGDALDGHGHRMLQARQSHTAAWSPRAEEESHP